MNARLTLKARTAKAHDRVDELFSRFDLGDEGDYRRFLTAQAEAFLPVEASLDAAGAETVIEDWAQRRRARAILEDLETLGIPAPPREPCLLLPSPPAILGAAYVLEGSRLGGAILKKRVAAHMPRRFLDADQGQGAWRKLLEKLERSLYENGGVEAAVMAAGQVFERFEAAAGRHMKAG